MWARVLSVVFHPLFIPTYFFSFLAWALPTCLEPVTPELHLQFLIFVFLITSALPLLNVGIFKAFGSIGSFTMPERRERIMPFIFISLIYVVVTYLFHVHARMDLNHNFMKLMVIIDLLVIASTVATFFFKVSVHSVTMWGVIGMLVPLNKLSEVNALFYATLAVIVLAGLVMGARLQTGAHSFREVMWGAVLGLIASVSGMLYLF